MQKIVDMKNKIDGLRRDSSEGSGKQQAAQQGHGQHSHNYPAAQAAAQQVVKPPEGRRRSMAEGVPHHKMSGMIVSQWRSVISPLDIGTSVV